VRARTLADLRAGLAAARDETRTTVIAVEVHPDEAVPGYESWWDVAVAEVSEVASVAAAREAYEAARRDERSHV
jgi:3D-(3,5/4)-trihydroxycyclohexane-1,2-dione acylhydrolase (decyclizing)